jgi:hypothetical protein
MTGYFSSSTGYAFLGGATGAAEAPESPAFYPAPELFLIFSRTGFNVY